MNVAFRKVMTREQFFLWAEAQDGRYEFDGEQPVAMVGGTNNHGLVVANIVSELKTRLRGKMCRVLPSEGGGVATVGQIVRYPDATVTCSRIPGQERLIPDPVVVFEVVSDSTAREDRVAKMREYHAVGSIKRYVIVEQSSPVIVAYCRAGDEPWVAVTLSVNDMLALPEVGIAIPVAEIVDGVGFGEDEV